MTPPPPFDTKISKFLGHFWLIPSVVYRAFKRALFFVEYFRYAFGVKLQGKGSLTLALHYRVFPTYTNCLNGYLDCLAARQKEVGG